MGLGAGRTVVVQAEGLLLLYCRPGLERGQQLAHGLTNLICHFWHVCNGGMLQVVMMLAQHVRSSRW